MATQITICPKCDSMNVTRHNGRCLCESCGFTDYGDAFGWKVAGHLVYDDAQAAADWRDEQETRWAASRGVL